MPNPTAPVDAYRCFRCALSNPPPNVLLCRATVGSSPLHRERPYERCRRATPWPLFPGPGGGIRCRLTLVSRAKISKRCSPKTSILGRLGISGRHRQASRGPGYKRDQVGTTGNDKRPLLLRIENHATRRALSASACRPRYGRHVSTACCSGSRSWDGYPRNSAHKYMSTQKTAGMYFHGCLDGTADVDWRAAKQHPVKIPRRCNCLYTPPFGGSFVS